MGKTAFYCLNIWLYQIFSLTLQRKVENNMEQKGFNQYSDDEFKAALLATMNLKKEWMAAVDKREKELGLR